MYTFYQKMILKELAYHIFCVLTNMDDRQYTSYYEKYMQSIVDEISETFNFDFDSFNEDNDNNYQSVLLNHNELPLINFNDTHFNLLRKLIEIIRIESDIMLQDNPYSTENHLYRLVFKNLPEQFCFNYFEHLERHPLPSLTSLLESEGFVELEVEKNVIWAYPPNILHDKSGCISSIFKFQAEAMLFAFGEEFLLEQFAFRKKSDYELWKERENLTKNKQSADDYID